MTLAHETVRFDSGKFRHDVVIETRRSCREEEQVHRRADRLCVEAGLAGHAGRGGHRKMGISDAMFYNWRTKYGGLSPSELRRLKQLEEENAKLKRLVAVAHPHDRGQLPAGMLGD